MTHLNVNRVLGYRNAQHPDGTALKLGRPRGADKILSNSQFQRSSFPFLARKLSFCSMAGLPITGHSKSLESTMNCRRLLNNL